jgi:DHA1 family bicyclomycin/chloramphenicol resistance-like MFS transporter
MVGMMIMNQINMRLVLKFRGSHLLKVGTVGAAISGILLALVTCTGWGGMWAMAALLFVFVAWFGLITTNSISGAMADFPNRAGSASALVGAAQYGFGMIGATVVGLVADGTPRFFGIVLAISGIGSFLFTLMARDKP